MFRELKLLEINKKYFFVVLGMLCYLTLLGVFISYGIQQGIDIALGEVENKSIFSIAIMLIALAIIYMITSYYHTVYTVKLTEDVAIKLKSKGIRWLVAQPLIEGEKLTKGEALQLISVDCNKIANSITNLYLQMFNIGARVVFYSAYILILSKELYFLLMILTPIIILVSKKFSTEYAKNYEKGVKEEEKMKTLFQQIQLNANILKVHNITDKVSDKVNNQFNKKLIYIVKQFKAAGTILNITQLITQLSKILLVVFGMYLISSDKITYGILLSIFTLGGELMWCISQLPKIVEDYKINDVSFKRIEKFFDYGSECSLEVETLGKCELVVQDVTFEYPNSNYNVIENFNYNFKRNEITYILGESGVGKSTLLKLILGLYKEKQGKVYIESKDKIIKNYGDYISYVPQNNTLLETSIFENLSLGRDVCEDEILEVLEKVNLLDEINRLNKGIYSVVGKDVTFSVGQNQRLCVSRALLTKSHFVVLDEPFSALDSENTKALMILLQEVKKERGVIVVSHDTQSKDIADNIVRLEKGGIYYV